MPGFPLALPLRPGAKRTTGFVPFTSPASLGPYILDRVKETTTTEGIGTLSLAGVGSFNGDSFVTAVGSGNSCLYEIVHQTLNERETGMGIVTAGVNGGQDTLTRDPAKVTAGSNGKSLVNFSAGTKDVFITIPAVIASPTNTQYNVKSFGAKGDVVLLTDGAMIAGQAVLTSASAVFTASDVNKAISVKGPGVQGNSNGVANYVLGVIVSVQSPTQVTLSVAATTTLSGCNTYYGTDDAPAINAATFAASIKGGVVYFPPGIYFIGSAIVWYTHTHLIGSGSDTTTLMLCPGAVCDIIQSYGYASLVGTGSREGVYGCSIRDISINGWYQHGGFPHATNTTAILSTDTTLTVDSTAMFPSSGTLLVYGDGASVGEVVAYTGKTPTTFTGCTRGQENTFAVGQASGISIDLRSTDGLFSSGSGIRDYGYGFVLSNVYIRQCDQDGIRSDWTTGQGNSIDSIEAFVFNVKAHECNGHGINWKGPHDSFLVNIVTFTNALIGVRTGVQAAGVQILAAHSYGNQVYAYSLEGVTLLYNSVGEQGVFGQCYIGVTQSQVVGCRFFANPSQIFARGIVLLSTGVTGCLVDASIIDCNGGSIDFTGDNGFNYFRLQITQRGGGATIIGTPNTNSNVQITTQLGNVNALSGTQTQMAGPFNTRSVVTGSAQFGIRPPNLLTANQFEAQDSTGAGITVIDAKGRVGIKQATPTFGLHQLGGSQRLAALGTPATPTGTPFGGSGTAVLYYVVAEDIAGNKTLPSASVSISGGAALSASI